MPSEIRMFYCGDKIIFSSCYDVSQMQIVILASWVLLDWSQQALLTVRVLWDLSSGCAVFCILHYVQHPIHQKSPCQNTFLSRTLGLVCITYVLPPLLCWCLFMIGFLVWTILKILIYNEISGGPTDWHALTTDFVCLMLL